MSCQNSEVDSAQETRIVVQALKIERLEEKQAELLERIRGLKKWVFGAAAVITAGVNTLRFISSNIKSLSLTSLVIRRY